MPPRILLRHGCASTHEGKPIGFLLKPKRHRKLQNVFLDDRGFPDQSDKYDHLLHSIDGGDSITETTPSNAGPQWSR